MIDQSLSNDSLPECWSDDVKMNALFAPFRPKESNPIAWESKMIFWKDMINKWCWKSQQICFTEADLISAFKRNGRTPKCIRTVIEEMLRCKEIVLKSSIAYMPSKQSWTRWAVGLMIRPYFWAFSKIKNVILQQIEEPSTFVHIEVLKIQATSLRTVIDELHRTQVFSLKDLRVIFFTKDLEIIIKWLNQNGKVAVHFGSEDQEMLIKFAPVGQRKVVEITELDVGIHALQHNEQTLVHHLQQLEKERLQMLEQAQMYVKREMHQSAKSCLRTKRELQKCIERRTGALDNVRQLLARIREAESDVKVLEAYKLGAAALKLNFKSTGLTEDNVADTVLEVQEVLDIQDEIQANLAQPISSTDEQELEKELNDLLTADTDIQSADLQDEEKLIRRLSCLGMSSLPQPLGISSDENIAYNKSSLNSRSKENSLPEVPDFEPTL